MTNIEIVINFFCVWFIFFSIWNYFDTLGCLFMISSVHEDAKPKSWTYTYTSGLWFGLAVAILFLECLLHRHQIFLMFHGGWSMNYFIRFSGRGQDSWSFNLGRGKTCMFAGIKYYSRGYSLSRYVSTRNSTYITRSRAFAASLLSTQRNSDAIVR